MDEEGWNGLSTEFTDYLNHGMQSTSDDFFEQVNQINFCLAKRELLEEDEDEDEKFPCTSLFDSTQAHRLSTVIKPEIPDDDEYPDANCGTDSYDYVTFTRIKREPSDERPNVEDLYKFDDFSSGSDCGSCSPSDFGPCASSNGSSKILSVSRPNSLPLSGNSLSSTSCKLEDDDFETDNVAFTVDSEPDIPSPTPPANEASPSTCAAMLERMGNINDAPMAAPLLIRGVRGPRTSLQTMTGSGGYTPLTGVDSFDNQDGRRHCFGSHKSHIRSLAHPMRNYLQQTPASRHRSLHSRKTPHYARPHPGFGSHHSSLHRPSNSSTLHSSLMRPGEIRSPKFEDEENPPRLWKFLFDLLEGKRLPHKLVEWTDRSTLTFRLLDSKEVSRLWGIKKHKPNMCYESLGRSLRYYYGKGVLEKVETQRLCYRYKREHLVKNGIYIS